MMPETLIWYGASNNGTKILHNNGFKDKLCSLICGNPYRYRVTFSNSLKLCVN